MLQGPLLGPLDGCNIVRCEVGFFKYFLIVSFVLVSPIHVPIYISTPCPVLWP